MGNWLAIWGIGWYGSLTWAKINSQIDQNITCKGEIIKKNLKYLNEYADNDKIKETFKHKDHVSL